MLKVARGVVRRICSDLRTIAAASSLPIVGWSGDVASRLDRLGGAVIGYYVHHQGLGHVNRALAVAAAVEPVVVGLSSLPRPLGWVGPWVRLPPEDEGLEPAVVSEPGRPHWVPEGDSGLTARMAEISSWIADVEPALIVADVSTEVSLLARLHGTPVITMVQPGDRRDSAHDLVHSVARRIVAAWPSDVIGMAHGLDAHRDRLICVGGISQFDGRDPVRSAHRDGKRRVVVLQGEPGEGEAPWGIAAARRATPEWTWDVVGLGGTWIDDPWETICDADVVMTHAGLNTISDIAAARRPGVVVPRGRLFHEQDFTASALGSDGRWPVIVCPTGFPEAGLLSILEDAARLDGSLWSSWSDGKSAGRIADVIHEELGRT